LEGERLAAKAALVESQRRIEELEEMVDVEPTSDQSTSSELPGARVLTAPTAAPTRTSDGAPARPLASPEAAALPASTPAASADVEGGLGGSEDLLSQMSSRLSSRLSSAAAALDAMMRPQHAAIEEEPEAGRSAPVALEHVSLADQPVDRRDEEVEYEAGQALPEDSSELNERGSLVEESEMLFLSMAPARPQAQRDSLLEV
jgi:hypothetical protein